MREPQDSESSEQAQLQEGRDMKGEDSPKREKENIPGEKNGFDFSCFEETEDDAHEEEDLDPATFRQFVEDAAERMSSSGSLAGLTSNSSAHSLEGDGQNLNLPAETRPLPLPAHTRLGYNQLVGQDAWIVIAISPPFHVLAVSPAWTELFGFREKEIVGRSLRMVQGPQTNVRDLAQFIKTAGETGKPSQAAFMFYTKRMEARMMTIDVSPERDDDDEGEGHVTHAVVTMDHSDWVPKKIAFAEDSRAKAVILADKPNSVVSISQQFADLYQLKEEMIVGRTLRAIFGPNTAVGPFGKTVALAKTGKTQNLDLRTCRADVSEVHVKLTLFPVMEAAAISHVMIVFKEVKVTSPSFPSLSLSLSPSLHRSCSLSPPIGLRDARYGHTLTKCTLITAECPKLMSAYRAIRLWNPFGMDIFSCPECGRESKGVLWFPAHRNTC